VNEWVASISDINEARQLIQAKLPEIEEAAYNVLDEQQSSHDVQVNYGTNVEFPIKKYGNFLYPAGEYEAIVITLGEGLGENWWCVLFPPLCFLDFASDSDVVDDNMETVQKEEDENVDDDSVTIKFFLFEWLGWS